ncbi:uncharacterized protein ACA1_155150 [Acanthamoeba castellanii str. Neff]|uniref:Uncharacterized protein n=1 Tax=Acanthamoeba castellanii (strain ATCC 30010 / Neff) TaxID=1257118 RepID=L8GZA3_ACACF|nr:uncharacterized protein ACA1_155150 [Acanthamoeba castellanii str. Neff]ELR18569.1 hypothetical protein ACA1_155150 [Acanthamoeba castellanii str. Neff]
MANVRLTHKHSSRADWRRRRWPGRHGTWRDWPKPRRSTRPSSARGAICCRPRSPPTARPLPKKPKQPINKSEHKYFYLYLFTALLLSCRRRPGAAGPW